MSGITDQGTSFVLELELGGVRFYFGEVSQDLTNRYGHPTAIRVHGTNLFDVLTTAFDIASDQTADTSIAINDLKVPVRLPDVFRENSGENMVGCRAEIKLVKDGGDWGEGWTQAVGVVTNPVLMSTQAPEDTLSFSINKENGSRADFPHQDYLVKAGWLDDDDQITVATSPESAFGLDPGDIQIGDIDWSATNFLFSTADVVLTLPSTYNESPQYVPFVFGRPGIAGGDDDVELWKDLNGNGSINDAGGFSVGSDERLRYFTTHGQTVCVQMLQATSVDDPDVDNSDGGTKLRTVLDDIAGEFTNPTSVVDVNDLADGTSYVFAHQDVCLWARVAIHAGEAAQVGSPIYMVDREHYGTPYSRGGSYTATLGYTARGRPYTYVDIKVDYSAYLEILNPQDMEDTGFEVYVVLSGSSSEFHAFGEEWSGAGFNEEDATALWLFFYACWVTAIRAGANTAQVLEAFFGNQEVQRVTDVVFDSGGRIYQDIWLSCFNTAMGARQTIKYPTADPLDAHCPGNWTQGGQIFLDGQVAENPAELVMVLCEGAGVAYERGSFFELRDSFRGWQLAGFIDEVTDVADYITSVMQGYLPFTIADGPDGIVATYWKWDATKLDACHHFVEGVDLEVVGEGVVVNEVGMMRSLRLSGRRVNWLHQESLPYGTFKPVETSQLKAKELQKLERLRGRIGISVGWKRGHAAARRLAKFERHLRSTYGQWDFSQDSEITEEQAFWRTNNYTGDVEAAAQGKWDENQLTFPVEDTEREQWSRYVPHPLLIGAFRRYEKQDRDDTEIELPDVYDTATMQRVADFFVAARSQPDVRFQGISPRSRGWIKGGDVVRVTAPTFGFDDRVCLIVQKGWQATNVLWEFRPIRLPARDTTPLPATPVVEEVFAEFVATGEPYSYDLLLLFDDGDASEDFFDDGVHGFTITYGTNDHGFDAQTTDQVWDGVSSFQSYCGGGTPGHGGRASVLNWPVSTAWDWGSNPDILFGGVVWPTFDRGGGRIQVLLISQRSVGDYWRIWYDDLGQMFYESKAGGATKCSLSSTVNLVYGEWNAWYLSLHGGVAKFWIGTIASGFVNVAGSAADTSPYNIGSGGTTTGRVGEDATASDGYANWYMDHEFIALDLYIDDSNGGTRMPVPTAQPTP
jgi:hypothetical protein